MVDGDPGRRRRVAAAAATWAALATVAVFCGVADGELVCDDAYYYFEIARNAARGEGFSFDSLTETNGFHPLYGLSTTLLYAFLPDDPWLPIHAALVLLCVLPVAATAPCLFALFDRRGLAFGGEVAALTWLLNPYTAILTFRGLEGPLQALLIAATALLLDGIRRRGSFRPGEMALLGAGLGLCELARTDTVLWIAAVAAVLARDMARAGRWRQLLARGALCAGTAALVASPWFVWNLLRFGTIAQTSFLAKQMFDLYGQLPPILPERVAGVGDVVGVAGAAVGNLLRIASYNARYIAGEEWAPIQRGLWVLAALVPYSLALALIPRGGAAPEAGRRGPGLLAPFGWLCVVHFAWYAWVARNYYNWYFLPPVLAFAVFHGERLARLRRLRPRLAAGAAQGAIGLLGVTTLLLFSLHAFAIQEHDDETDYLRGAGRTIEALPPGARIGLWNAGQTGYFASFHHPDRTIVNLDGVVNNEVTRWESEGRYEEYLLRNVDFIIEPPEYMRIVVGEARAARFVARHMRPGDPRIRRQGTDPVR
jgi:hypothetical protein